MIYPKYSIFVVCFSLLLSLYYIIFQFVNFRYLWILYLFNFIISVFSIYNGPKYIFNYLLRLTESIHISKIFMLFNSMLFFASSSSGLINIIHNINIEISLLSVFIIVLLILSCSISIYFP